MVSAGNPLDLVAMTPLMLRGTGSADVRIALIDGPVVLDHASLARENIQQIPGRTAGACTRAGSFACEHGTFVAGILSAKRNSGAPAICPGCTLLLRPIFPEETSEKGHIPTATPRDVASAFVECVDAGAHLINFSAALAEPRPSEEKDLREALDFAAAHQVIVIVAAGNQGRIGSSSITRHPWVVPVVACSLQGPPTPDSNLAASIGKRGLRAPGDNITSLGPDGQPRTLGGTSAATPFVTGAVALLLSEFPSANAIHVKLAILQARSSRRRTVVPPLLNAWAARQELLEMLEGKRTNESTKTAKAR